MDQERHNELETSSCTSASFFKRRARNYSIVASVYGAGTLGVLYEASHALQSESPTEVLLGGVAALAALGGSIATIGSIHSAVESYQWGRQIDSPEE